MSERDRRPSVASGVAAQVVLVGFAVLGYTTNSASPDNSGIVEETVGGAGSAFVVTLVIVGAPAIVGGVLVGLLARRATRLRRIGQLAVGVALAAFGGVMVAALTEQECDGTCTDVPVGVLLASFAAAELALGATWAIAWLLASTGRR